MHFFFHDVLVLARAITVAECHNVCHDSRQNTLLGVVNSVVRHDRMLAVMLKLLHPGVKSIPFLFLGFVTEYLQERLKRYSLSIHTQTECPASVSECDSLLLNSEIGV